MGRLTRPLVPDGPIRRFYERLHELHQAAGEPSMRQLQRASRSPRRPNGINPTTIHHAFTLPQLSRWEVVHEIVSQLGGDVDELAELWRRAREAQLARTEDPTGVPNQPHRDVPRELPADITGFTGRTGHLKELEQLLDRVDETAAVAAITGLAGVGKTALALRWCHRVADRFPDGALYLNLRGYSPAGPRVHPVEALTQFLRTLGVPPDQIPTDTGAAARRYRSALSGRRMLVLLDDAAGPEQVRPLLPGSPGCLLLITSRDRLSGLVAQEGAYRLSLDVLNVDESRELLARVLGGERVAAEPAAAAELARACSQLPLALRVAAANLSNHPGRGIGAHLAQLRQDRGLAMWDLDGDEAGVRHAFDLSYHAAPSAERRLFRLLGLVPGADTTVAAAAALADLPVLEAGRLLDRLAGAHLVYESEPGRYARHDLLHRYAAELAGREEPPAAREAALGRWYEWYVTTTDAAARMLYPHRLRLPIPAPSRPPTVDFADRGAALAWLDAERTNLVSVITHAAGRGVRTTAWLLADSLHGYFWLRMHLHDWDRAGRTALTAAEEADNAPAQAAALLSLGDRYLRQNADEAIRYYFSAREIARWGGWVEGEAAAHGHLATAHRVIGRLAEATEHYQRALARYRDCGSSYGEAVTEACLGGTAKLAGRFAAAAAHLQRSLALHRTLGSRLGEAVAQQGLGQLCLAKGELSAAGDHLNRALGLEREIGDRGNEAFTLRDLALLHSMADRPAEGMRHAQQGLSLARQIGDRRAEMATLNAIATIHRQLGCPAEAAAASAQARDLDADHYLSIETLLGLAAAEHLLHRTDKALGNAERARDLAAGAGYSLLHRAALNLIDELKRPGPGSPRKQPKGAA